MRKLKRAVRLGAASMTSAMVKLCTVRYIENSPCPIPSEFVTGTINTPLAPKNMPPHTRMSMNMPAATMNP